MHWGATRTQKKTAEILRPPKSGGLRMTGLDGGLRMTDDPKFEIRV